MVYRFICYLVVFTIGCLDLSCRSHLAEHSGRLLASVGDSKLYESDLKLRLPAGKDSFAFKEKLVEDWVKKQLIFKKAMSELSQAQKNKDEQLKDYYESLINYEYLRKLIEENSDTTASEEEMKEYYKENLNNFKLQDNRIRNSHKPDSLEIAPYNTVKNDIRRIIINQKKALSLKEAENQIYREGETEKLFEIYNYNTQKK